MTQTIEVEIYGQRYAIRGDADEPYMRKLAACVDDHMRAVAKGMKTATLSKLAVLAAINISHQLFESQRLRETEEADVEHRVLCLMDTIDTLEDTAPASGCR